MRNDSIKVEFNNEPDGNVRILLDTFEEWYFYNNIIAMKWLTNKLQIYTNFTQHQC